MSKIEWKFSVIAEIMEVEDICFDPMGAAMLENVFYPGNTVPT